MVSPVCREQFITIANQPIHRTGLRYRLSRSAVGSIILGIFNLCCCGCLMDAHYRDWSRRREYLYLNRPAFDDPDFIHWERAVRHVNLAVPYFSRISIHQPRRHHVFPVTSVNLQPHHIYNTSSSSFTPRVYRGPSSIPTTAPLILDTRPTFTSSVPMPSFNQRATTAFVNSRPTSAPFTVGPTDGVHASRSSFGAHRPFSVAPGTRRG